MRRAARLALFAAGVAAGVALLAEHHHAVGEALARVGWAIGPFMLASLLLYALDAAGWRYCFLPRQPVVGFGRLFSIRMAGEAVNKVTPLASLGGEPLKAYLLTGQGSNAGEAAASVAIAKNTMTISQIAFIVTGLALGWTRLPGHHAYLVALALFPLLVFGGIVVTVGLDLALRRRKSGRSGPVEVRKPLTGWRGKIAGIASVWPMIMDFAHDQPRAFSGSVLLFYLGWAAGTLELLAGAWALGMPLSVFDALVMEAILVSVNMGTFFIPANAGSQEAGFFGAAQMLGLGAGDGLGLALLRRCRDFLWIAFGLGYLAVTHQGWLTPAPAPARYPPSSG